VSCPAIFCVVADTCEKPKLISSYVKNCTIHKQNSDSNKAKNCLENEWILGIVVEQGKPATLATVATHVLTLFLWIINVPQHEI